MLDLTEEKAILKVSIVRRVIVPLAVVLSTVRNTQIVLSVMIRRTTVFFIEPEAEFLSKILIKGGCP